MSFQWRACSVPLNRTLVHQPIIGRSKNQKSLLQFVWTHQGGGHAVGALRVLRLQLHVEFCRAEKSSLGRWCSCSGALDVSDSVTLWTVALQALLSVKFFRQEYCSGLPCLPPGDRPPSAPTQASTCVSYTSCIGRQVL